MEERPKIKLVLSPLDRRLEITGKLFLLLIWGVSIYAYLKFPTIVPTHFNAAGKVDGYGNKSIIFILTLLATVIYIGLTQLGRYPHIFNYIPKITMENAARQYTLATRLLRFLKLAVLIIISMVILFLYLATAGIKNGPGAWFLPFAEVLLLLPTILTISRSVKK